MNTNKVLLGGLVGGVALFFLGWLVYGMLLQDFMAANFNHCMDRPMEGFIWWGMAASNLFYGVLLAIILDWSNSSGIMDGVKKSALVGALFALNVDFSFYSMSTMFNNMGGMFMDVFVFTLMTAVTGGIISWVMSMGKK